MGRPSKYPVEVRERAVRLARESQRPIAHVARDLGVHPETLRVWVRQAEADAGVRADRLSSADHGELVALRRENRELRRANEILKAASVFFARELDQPWAK
jgi:transposase